MWVFCGSITLLICQWEELPLHRVRAIYSASPAHSSHGTLQTINHHIYSVHIETDFMGTPWSSAQIQTRFQLHVFPSLCPPNLPPVRFQSMCTKEQKANSHLGFSSSALVNSDQWSRSYDQKEQMCAWPLKRTAEPYICTGRRIYISLHLCSCDWRVVACLLLLSVYAAVIALSRA